MWEKAYGIFLSLVSPDLIISDSIQFPANDTWFFTMPVKPIVYIDTKFSLPITLLMDIFDDTTTWSCVSVRESMSTSLSTVYSLWFFWSISKRSSLITDPAPRNRTTICMLGLASITHFPKAFLPVATPQIMWQMSSCSASLPTYVIVTF